MSGYSDRKTPNMGWVKTNVYLQFQLTKTPCVHLGNVIEQSIKLSIYQRIALTLYQSIDLSIS